MSEELKPSMTPLQKAARAVIDRWETPLWKDEAPTGDVIYSLRDALNAELAAPAVEPVQSADLEARVAAHMRLVVELESIALGMFISGNSDAAKATKAQIEASARELATSAAQSAELEASIDKAWGRFEAEMKRGEDKKAARVHALVNAGAYPGMSEAFDRHMGAACWTEQSYSPDAAMWAAAWKAALSTVSPQQSAEPVAWRTFDGEGAWDYRSYESNETYRDEYISRNSPKYASWVEPLYTHPPQRKPEPLNFHQLQQVMAQHFSGCDLTDDEADSAEAFARRIERAHGITATEPGERA